MATRVEVKPELFDWAISRARLEPGYVMQRFPKLREWGEGSAHPTFKQLEKFAAVTHTPIGFFFLPVPPEESVPIADFRTLGGAAVPAPSANLLDTLYLCQQRRDWYRDFSLTMGEASRAFIGSLTTTMDPVEAARRIEQVLSFDLGARKSCSTWAEAQRQFVANCEDAGILVMISGVVGNNTSRILDTEEFRGFCLVDDRAPVVFVNGADSKSAQMFTLAHEVAHLWLGESGLSNVTLSSESGHTVERWCNAVAAELLVPLKALRAELKSTVDVAEQLHDLCRTFKVSSLVILRRLLDANIISRKRFNELYAAERAWLEKRTEKSSGGDFYKSEAVRVSRRFATALLLSTLEGNTLFRDASRLLGIKKAATLDHFAAQLGLS
jgi:Zn-dependent peptidase ImmA (M78 family)